MCRWWTRRCCFFFFSSRRRHTRCGRDWSSDVCSSDLASLWRVNTDGDLHLVLSLSCPDRPGIVAAVAGLLAEHGGNITESQQFGDPLSGLFFMRVQVVATAPEADLRSALTELAARFSMTWRLDLAGRPMRTIVMVSTAAHCLHDLLFRRQSEGLPVDIAAVVSNHTTLAHVAEFYSIPFHHVPVTPETKPRAEARLLELV